MGAKEKKAVFQKRLDFKKTPEVDGASSWNVKGQNPMRSHDDRPHHLVNIPYISHFQASGRQAVGLPFIVPRVLLGRLHPFLIFICALYP